jgi:hypothetical protein
MSKIDSLETLRQSILLLEKRQSDEEKLLREQVKSAYQYVQPANLIKSTLKVISSSPDLKESLVSTTVGISVGYVSKLLFQGASHSPVRKLVGTALMFGITNMIAKHPEVIKSIGNLFSKSTNPKESSNTDVKPNTEMPPA